MVSFQCHGCGDVVKKPKLDQHHGRCHAGFDCIDCSVTFNTPTEFKAHTSCITEAEKYQKSLYKGPKSGGENGNGYANGGRGGFQGRGRGSGRDTFQGRGGHQGRGQPRNKGTGANGTPLGTPQRMSPVTPPVDDTLSQCMKNPTVDVAAPASSPTKNDQEVAGPSSERPKKEKKSKDKKSKSKKSGGELETNMVKDTPIPPPSADKVGDVAEKKKSKKKRKDEEGGQIDVVQHSKVDVDELGKGDASKEKKKKKSKGDLSAGDSTNVKAKGDGSKGEAGEQERTVPAKERKKKKDAAPVVDARKVGSEKQEVNEESREKDKKRKHKKVSDEPPVVPPAEHANAPPEDGDSGKRSKKRKREAEGTENGDVAVVNSGLKGTKKGPKDGAGAILAAAEGKKRKRQDGKDAGNTSVPGEKEKKKRKRKENTEDAEV